jgi:putative hydrolase of the HAD superfamily
MGDIKVLLFDLGGVVIKLQALDIMHELTCGSMTREEVYKRLTSSAAVRLLETGKYGINEFAAAITEELSLKISPEAFIREFEYFVTEPIEETYSAIKAIPPEYITAVFSNTSCFHWESLCGRYAIDRLFERHFLSYKMGMIKPDRNAYEYVIGELGCRPDEICFFDDTRANVDMASELGIKAYQVTGSNTVSDMLKELKVIH